MGIWDTQYSSSMAPGLALELNLLSLEEYTHERAHARVNACKCIPSVLN